VFAGLVPAAFSVALTLGVVHQGLGRIRDHVGGEVGQGEPLPAAHWAAANDSNGALRGAAGTRSPLPGDAAMSPLVGDAKAVTQASPASNHNTSLPVSGRLRRSRDIPPDAAPPQGRSEGRSGCAARGDGRAGRSTVRQVHRGDGGTRRTAADTGNSPSWSTALLVA
jgi:hypothetical protein